MLSQSIKSTPPPEGIQIKNDPGQVWSQLDTKGHENGSCSSTCTEGILETSPSRNTIQNLKTINPKVYVDEMRTLDKEESQAIPYVVK